MSDRREELLDAATLWAFEHGLAELSLRPLAKALGTSDRMLIYYFDSKDELVVEIAGRAADLLVAGLPEIDPDRPPRSAKAWLDACWERYGDPASRPALSLLFEIDASGTRSPGHLRDAARTVAERWSDSVDRALAALGVPARSRTGLTPVLGAALVGLAIEALLDDEPARPGPALATLARLVDGERR